MSRLFPEAPFIPAAAQHAKPACEWVAPTVRRRDAFRICNSLPPGMPDSLQVHVGHSPEGTERCTAAIYGGRAYVVHYEWKVRAGG